MFGFHLNKLSPKKPVRNFWDHSAECDFKRFTGGDLEKSQRKLSHQKREYHVWLFILCGDFMMCRNKIEADIIYDRRSTKTRWMLMVGYVKTFERSLKCQYPIWIPEALQKSRFELNKAWQAMGRETGMNFIKILLLNLIAIFLCDTYWNVTFSWWYHIPLDIEKSYRK